ncbi:MAG: hypothetical protein IJ191_01730 [Treponema sp.]|nr:hypothetical protein [Treponema sp.]
MKRIIISMCGICLFLATAGAQSADRISRLLDAKEVTYAQMAYLAGTQLGLITDETADETAFRVFKESGRIPKIKAQAEDVITLSGVAYMLAQVYQIKGGLFYRMTKAPRYAFRQLQADEIISSAASPRKKPTGSEVLAIITSCIEQYPEQPAAAEAL